MTEYEAGVEGLQFTGAYSHDKEKIKAEALEIRNFGFRARVVTVPPSRYGRGSHAMGYSIYAEPAYAEARALRREYESAKYVIENADKRITQLQAEIEDYKAKKAAAEALLAGPEPKKVR